MSAPPSGGPAAVATQLVLRALLVDPDWAVKVRDGREEDILPFSRDALGKLE